MGPNLVVEGLLKQRAILLQEATELLEETEDSIDRMFSALETTQQIFEQVEEINQKLVGISETGSKDSGYKVRIEKLMALMEARWKALKKTKAMALEHKRRLDKGKDAAEGYIHPGSERVFVDKNV